MMKFKQAVMLVCLMIIPASCSPVSKKSDSVNIAFVDTFIQQGYLVRTASEIAVNEKNLAGGIAGRKVTLTEISISSKPAKKNDHLETQLKNKEYHGIICAAYSHDAREYIAPIAESNKIAMISSTSSFHINTKNYSYIFRMLASDRMQAAAMADYAVDTLKCKTAGILYQENDSYDEALASDFKTYFTQKGGNVVFNEQVKSFGENEIAKILSGKKADALYLPLKPSALKKILAAAKMAGFDSKFLGPDSFFYRGVLTIKPEDAARIYISNSAKAENPGPAYQAFAKKFRAKTGKEPTIFTIKAYDAANILMTAIEKTLAAESAGHQKNLKFSREKLKDYIYSTEFEGLIGKIAFTRSGYAMMDVGIYKVDTDKKAIRQISVIPSDKSISDFPGLKKE